MRFSSPCGGGAVRSPLYVVMGMCVVAAGLGLLTPVPAIGQTAAQGWMPPRTPDGHSDLRGVWANNNATPLERPEAWAGKARLTEEELADLVTAAAGATDPGQDALFGDQLVLAAIARDKATSYDPTTGNYNQFWTVERTFTDKTSLVVDPPDGRIPPLTDKAQAAQREQEAFLLEEPADSWADRPLHERCVTFGVPNLGAGYNSYFHIFQSKDHVVILAEMIHDARVIPIDGSPHLDASIHQLHGDSRDIGTATRSS